MLACFVFRWVFFVQISELFYLWMAKKGIVIKNDNPVGQGCISFQNNINAELTITFTSKDGKWNETFKVGRKAQQRHCFRAGEYTFTVDAPPPWESYNERIIILPGANLTHPVNPG